MIAIRRCPNSTRLKFYILANGTFVSSINYKFQLHTTSGAHFGSKYQAGTFVYRLDETTSVFAPKFALESHVYIHTHLPPCVAKIIGIPTYEHPNIYTVTFKDGSIAEYTDNILTAALEISPIQQQPILPLWIKGMQVPHYFSTICQSLDMVFYLYLRLMTGTSIRENQRKVYYYQI